jgi:ABC-2 type transport system ATP-binding protein
MKTNDAVFAVEADGLVKTFGNNLAVDKVSLRIPTGTICGMLGPNGAGKTTIINMLATLLKPDSGTAKVFGYDVTKDAQIVRQLIGLTGQFASIDESLTAMQNLKIFGRLLGYTRTTAQRKAEELLEEFDLMEAANRPLSKFSGGMRRRLDLAASLLSQPPLIFLDEPTTGLDPRTRTQMWETIRSFVKNGSTVLLTTQYLEEADQLTDEIIIIDHGNVVARDTPDGLKESIGSVVLQLILKNADTAAEAARLVEHTLGAKAQITQGTKLSVPMDDADKLTNVLAALKEAGILLVEINVVKPSLDEVFFALTGSAITKENKEEN